MIKAGFDNIPPPAPPSRYFLNKLGQQPGITIGETSIDGTDLAPEAASAAAALCQSGQGGGVEVA